ncbi:MAG TPA: tetratricopeptide repeat protein [Thermoanaerobaculia bacterium]
MSGKAFQPMAIAVLVLLPSVAGAAGGADGPLAPGIQAFNAHRYEEARAFFEPYARRNPQDAEAAFYLGKTWLTLRKPDAAAEWLEKAAALAPGRSDYYDWLGRAYGSQAVEASVFAKAGLAKKTKETWEKAVALDPNNLDARADLMTYALQAPGFLGGGLDLARQQAAEIQKRDGVRGAVAYATIALHEKDPATAEKGLKEAIQRWPAEPRLRLTLGAAYQSQKKWDAAFDAYEAMAKGEAPNWDALYQIGKTAALSGQRLDRAEECLKRYLGHTPGPDSAPLANAQFRLGQVYEKKGNKTAARTAYQEALKLDPRLEDAKKALASLG